MDKYDDAVHYFSRASIEEVKQAWEAPFDHKHGCLFYWLTPDGKPAKRPDGKPCGCPSLIMTAYDDRYHFYKEVGWTDELTKKVVESEKLPKYLPCRLFVRREELAVFSDIQREADRTIRTPPQETSSGTTQES